MIGGLPIQILYALKCMKSQHLRQGDLYSSYPMGYDLGYTNDYLNKRLNRKDTGALKCEIAGLYSSTTSSYTLHLLLHNIISWTLGTHKTLNFTISLSHG